MKDSSHWRYHYKTDSKTFEREEEQALELVAPNEVLLRPMVVGICGSDLSKIAHEVENPPLGHEWAGVVVEIGSAVKDFEVGELVTSVANISCGTCEHCQNQRDELCKKRTLLGRESSVLSSQVLLHDHDLLKVPQSLDLASITLLEVAYIGDCAFNQAMKLGLEQNQKDQKIIIFGAGPIGVMTALSLKERGFDSHLIEVQPERIKAAKELGLECTAFAQEIIVRGFFGKCDVIFDCTGDAKGPGALKYLPLFAKMEAMVIIVGKYHAAQLSEVDFGIKALRLTWVANHQKENFKKSISFWESRIKKYSKQIIHFYSFDEIYTGFSEASEQKIMKAMLKVPEAIE